MGWGCPRLTTASSSKTTVSGGGFVGIGTPPGETSKDWVARVMK